MKTTLEQDQYKAFEESIKERFEWFTKQNVKLFKTNATNLYDIYLNHLPAESRQTYVCNACRTFFNRYGSLVLITQTGSVVSALWHEEDTPDLFRQAVREMKEAVVNAKVTGVFVAAERNLGIPKTGEWSHLAVQVPRSYVYTNPLQTAGQLMAEKREEFQMLRRALDEFSFNTAERALALVQTEELYRSDKVLGVATWFKEVASTHEHVHDAKARTNLIWLAVAQAPAGFTHIRSSMIGTLLEDLESGISTERVAARFAEKMKPSNYMRAQSAPTQNAIQEAEKVVAKLGIEDSLYRRYATIDEIPEFVWQNKEVEAAPVEKRTGGVFGHLTPKGQSMASDFDLPTSVMTWEKFQRTVMPTATGLEVLADDPSRFMALVTAADEKAPNILQWDNPFSWYYHGGIDGEIKRRVESAGGRYENNEIRVSLIWEGYTDLDIHAVTPSGSHIYFRNKRDNRSEGYLDIDANGGRADTATPVENIRWATDAPEGNYRFYVHNYQERGTGKTPYTVELEINGRVSTYKGVAGGTGFKEDVFEFIYNRGQAPQMKLAKGYETAADWGVEEGNFVKVNAITPSPNFWGHNQVTQAGTHVFFLLDGVQDKSEGKGRGFFNETLKSELRPIRKTLELFVADAAIEDADNASACGVGYSKDNEWNLTLKVTSGNSSRLVKIDRWD